MKFHWIRRLISFEWIRKGQQNNKPGQRRTTRKVVKFEDCQVVNQSFKVENMEVELNNRNQYFAALTGD